MSETEHKELKVCLKLIVQLCDAAEISLLKMHCSCAHCLVVSVVCQL